MKKIGIMGGTFDPIHYGHLIIAENAAEQFSLDHIFFMPTGHSPHKDDNTILSAEKRCEMISLAIKDNKKFSLSLYEVHSNMVNYTYQTLEAFTKEYRNTELYFILGADSLFNLKSWVHPERILNSCTILAAVRDEIDKDELRNKIEDLAEEYSASIFPLSTPNFDVSSQDIRKRAAALRTIKYMVPGEVERYILINKIYLERK